jgi:hypothetical protein
MVCYLAASCLPMPHDAPDCKLLLLGADHRQRGHAFPHAAAILRTEVYEYARALAGGRRRLRGACARPTLPG